MMRDVVIREIKVDADGRLVVVPDLPSTEDFRFIYRAAMEVSWDESSRGLSSPVPRPGGWSHPDWFHQISRAVAAEYDVKLLVEPATKWSVSDELRVALKKLGVR
jgi:hypothetical protein